VDLAAKAVATAQGQAVAALLKAAQSTLALPVPQV
jgi:hypothetical protein